MIKVCNECITIRRLLQGRARSVNTIYYFLLERQGFEAYFSKSWIARSTGYSVRTAANALKTLAMLGLIKYHEASKTWVLQEIKQGSTYQKKKADYMFSGFIQLKQERAEQEKIRMAKMNWRKAKNESREFSKKSSEVKMKTIVFDIKKLNSYTRTELKAFLDSMMTKYYQIKNTGNKDKAFKYYKDTVEVVQAQHKLMKHKQSELNLEKEARRCQMDRTSSFRNQA